MGIIGASKYLSGNEKVQVIVKTNQGAAITATNGFVLKSFSIKNGIALIKGLDDGTWVIKTSLNNFYKEQEVLISGNNERQVVYLYINLIPEFETSGLIYKIVDDDDNELNPFSGSIVGWKIRFEQLTNGSFGTITFKELYGQKVDIFLVGGGGNGTFSYYTWGGCGGGGGYTKTVKGITLEENVPYRISIGNSCESSSFKSDPSSTNVISYVAAGGKSGHTNGGLYGGDGGCGGAGGHGRLGDSEPAGKAGDGGTNGGDGTEGADGYFYGKLEQEWFSVSSYGGKGQESMPGPNGETGSTREFGEPNGKIYSSGGAGGSKFKGYEGVPGEGLRGANSGAGGSSNNYAGGKENGFSGIVIIRNSRE